MKTVIAQEDFAVFDDVLDEDSWSQLWTHLQFTDLSAVSKLHGAWRLTDGEPLAGAEFHWLPKGQTAPDTVDGIYPTQNPTDLFVDALRPKFDELKPWVGDEWIRLSGRPYVYGAGSGLSWHGDDTEAYCGAFIYYFHPEWNVQWGGELLVAAETDPDEIQMMPFRFDSRDYSAQLLERGWGHFVLPKPNRLVVLGGAPHKVCAVQKAAGEHVRASLAGFFLRQEPEE